MIQIAFTEYFYMTQKHTVTHVNNSSQYFINWYQLILIILLLINIDWLIHILLISINILFQAIFFTFSFIFFKVAVYVMQCNVLAISNLGQTQGWEDSPWRRKGFPLSFLVWKNSMDMYSPWSRKVWHNWATFLSLSCI